MEDRRFGVQNNQAAYDTTGERSQVTAGISDDAMKVLRNTYMLLGMTLAFSALTAFLNMNGTHPGFLITIVGYIGLLFATYKLKNSPWGIVTTFALTGFMGYTLGPIIGAFVAAGASQIVAQPDTDSSGLWWPVCDSDHHQERLQLHVQLPDRWRICADRCHAAGVLHEALPCTWRCLQASPSSPPS